MNLGPDLIFQVAPLGLYFLPTFIIDRLSFRFPITLSRWISLRCSAPCMASQHHRSAFIAPIAFLAVAPSARRLMPRLAATRWPELTLILSIALAVILAGP